MINPNLNLAVNLRQLDPSRTLTTRRAYAADYKRRWNGVLALAGEVVTPGVFRPGGRFYETTPLAKADSFASWLDTAVTNQVIASDRWQRPYIHAAYVRGLKNAHADLRRDGWEITEEPADLAHRLAHAPAINVFYSKAERALQTIQGDMLATVESKLAGRLAGLSANEEGEEESDEEWLLALLLLLLITGGQSALSRSRAIVSTGIVGVAAEAVLNRLAELGLRLVSPLVEMVWATAGDSKVCLRCQELATKDSGRGPGIYSIEEARGLIPVHVSCRCSWRTSVKRF